jgi:hypothetical protein
MKVRFETFIIIAAAAVAFAFVAFDGYCRQKETQIVERLQFHGFTRTAVITSLGAQPDDPDFDAADFIGANRNARQDGASVLSRRSLSELSTLPVVANVLGIAKSARKLSLKSGMVSDVNCFNVPPDFGDIFRLGGASAIAPGIYVPSAALRRAAHMGSEARDGLLGVADEVLGALPPNMRDRIDWSKATVPVRVSAAALELPADSPMFDTAVFTTGREPRIDVPGVYLIPTAHILVKLRDDVAVDAGMAQLASFVAHAAPATPGSALSLTPLMQFFADELGVDRYRSWGTHVRQGIGSAGVLLFSALVLVRQKRIRQEIALRRAVGAPAAWAAWLSIKGIVLGLASGVAAGALLGVALAFAATFAALPALAPSLAGLAAATCAAVVIMVSGAGLFSRDALASQLKRL